jgi:hypothetical protein
MTIWTSDPLHRSGRALAFRGYLVAGMIAAAFYLVMAALVLR